MNIISLKDREEFKNRFGDQSNVIRVGFSLDQLTGIGTEYLVAPGGIILGKFYDGNLVYKAPAANQERTLILL